MKNLFRITVFSILLLSFKSFSKVSFDQAEGLAKDYAMNFIFGEELEDTSSFEMTSKMNAIHEFVFEFKLTNYLGDGGPGTEYEICVAKILVNASSGKISEVGEKKCRDPRQKPKTIEKDVFPLAMKVLDSWPFPNRPKGSRTFRLEIEYCTLNDDTTPHIIGEIYLLTPGEIITIKDNDNKNNREVKHFSKFINANFRQSKIVSNMAAAQPCKRATMRQLLACTMPPDEGVEHTMCMYHFNKVEQITFDVYSDGSFTAVPTERN